MILLTVILTVRTCKTRQLSMEDPDGTGVFSHESANGRSSSLPRLDNGDYRDKGEVSVLGDLPIYTVGTGPKCIIWNYDIFGFDSGRTRQLCDYFAQQGYFVILPDYYRGALFVPGSPGIGDFLSQVSNWTSLRSDWDKVKQFALSKGAETFGTIGTCWGSYPVIRLSTLPDFKAGVSMHPSHSPIMSKYLNENEADILTQVKCPQLLMPSRTDSPNVKPDGLSEQILKDNVTIIEFNEMDHGWTTRGDLSVPNIDRDVHSALDEALKFFKRHL